MTQSEYQSIIDEEEIIARIIAEATQVSSQQIQNALIPHPDSGAGGVPPQQYFHPQHII